MLFSYTSRAAITQETAALVQYIDLEEKHNHSFSGISIGKLHLESTSGQIHAQTSLICAENMQILPNAVQCEWYSNYNMHTICKKLAY